MKNTMLAILAVALAALAPFALAAEGDSDKDDGGVSQPTLRQLANKIDSAVRRLGAVEATVGTLSTATAVDALTTEVRTLSSTVSANHTTIVGKFAPQMAIVQTVPNTLINATSPTGMNYTSTRYLVGESTIPGFPMEAVAADGSFGTGMNIGVPAGTYLIEVQHPYSDNVLCQSSVSRRGTPRGNDNPRFNSVCPWLRVAANRGGPRIDDGFGIVSHTSGFGILATHRFPAAFAFTDDKPLASYTGAIKITKLK